MLSQNILITGANRGLGFATVQALATQYPANVYFLGVRNLQAGTEAVRKLQSLGLRSQFHIVELDVASDISLQRAFLHIQSMCDHLNVLVNNAATASLVQPGEPGFRLACNSILDANVTSTIEVTTTFLPMLRASKSPRVISISSARASVQLQTTNKLPPTASIPYSISKTALNIAVLELAKMYPQIVFHAASPGHLKTAFNNFRGTKDPLEGARVVVGLASAEDQEYESGFWEFENGAIQKVPW